MSCHGRGQNVLLKSLEIPSEPMWTHVVLLAMIGWRHNGNCPCFLWDFHLLSSCHRHLICLFVVAGNIYRKKPKTNGLKIKRDSKQLSRKYMGSKQMSLSKPEILFFFLMSLYRQQDTKAVIFIIVSKGNDRSCRARWAGLGQDRFWVLALYNALYYL